MKNLKARIKMKKTIILLLTVALCALSLCSCVDKERNDVVSEIEGLSY